MPALCFFLASGLGFSALLFWKPTSKFRLEWAGRSTSVQLPGYFSRLCRRRYAHHGDWIQTRQRDGMNAWSPRARKHKMASLPVKTTKSPDLHPSLRRRVSDAAEAALLVGAFAVIWGSIAVVVIAALFG
jgi:hypothetical protein